MGAESSRFVLLDRDGVINRDLPGSVRNLDDFELLPEAAEAIVELNRKGYSVLVLTNQACVGRGELDPSELDEIHRLMQRLIADAGGHIDGIYVCFHTDSDNCTCRKPRPGLIEQARRDRQFDLATTWMVGDTPRDIEAARNAGCRPAYVRTGEGDAIDPPAGVPVFDNLAHFAREMDDYQNTS